MDIKESLRSKSSMKKRLPKFTRQSSHKKKRLGTKWRRAKGLHSKVRRQLRSRRKIVKVGYGTHKTLKHLTKEGLKQVHVFNLNELDKIDEKTEGILVGKSVGLKNRIGIVREAIKKKIMIINIKKPEEFLKKIDEDIVKKKEEKTERKKEKEDKKKELEKKAEEKKRKEEKVSTDKIKEEKDDGLTEKVKKEEEKKEKDKVLIKKE